MVTKDMIADFFNLYQQIVNESFELWTRESKDYWLNEDYSLKFWTELVNEGKCPVCVLEEENQLVGFTAVEGIDYGVVYLGWIGVLKKFQKKGFGDLLMNSVIEWAEKDKKIHKIELETQISELQHFYEKYGFVLEGIRKKSWQKLDNYMFGKVLNRNTTGSKKFALCAVVD